MWRCKKCGDEIIGDVRGKIESGWGFVDEEGTVDELQDFDLDFCVVAYRCNDCGAESQDLEEIAVWKD